MDPEIAPPAIDSPATLYRLLRERIRLRHYSLRTEHTYVYWTRRFIAFHGRRHPRELGAAQVMSFLGAMATEGNVSAATQNQALAALLFLYKEVLRAELPWLEGIPARRRAAGFPRS